MNFSITPAYIVFSQSRSKSKLSVKCFEFLVKYVKVNSKRKTVHVTQKIARKE